MTGGTRAGVLSVTLNWPGDFCPGFRILVGSQPGVNGESRTRQPQNSRVFCELQEMIQPDLPLSVPRQGGAERSCQAAQEQTLFRVLLISPGILAALSIGLMRAVLSPKV